MSLAHRFNLINNANDDIGSITGTITGSPTFSNEGLYFPGSPAKVTLSNNLIGTGRTFNYTLSVWVKSSPPNGTNHAITSNNLMNLVIGANASGTFIWANCWLNRNGAEANGTMYRFISPVGDYSGKWTHVVITSNISANTNNYLYINGLYIAQTALVSCGSTQHYNSIGADYQSYWGNIGYMIGNVKNMMLWNEQFTSNQINLLYRKQKIISSLF